MTDYNVDSFYAYTLDKYIHLFNNFYANTIDGKEYKCNKNYKLLEFTPLERYYYKKNKVFSKNLFN
jgi:hypothetical protein